MGLPVLGPVRLNRTSGGLMKAYEAAWGEEGEILWASTSNHSGAHFSRVLSIAPWHGRRVVWDRDSSKPLKGRAKLFLERIADFEKANPDICDVVRGLVLPTAQPDIPMPELPIIDLPLPPMPGALVASIARRIPEGANPLAYNAGSDPSLVDTAALKASRDRDLRKALEPGRFDVSILAFLEEALATQREIIRRRGR